MARIELSAAAGALVVLALAGGARGDGERTPMVGGSLLAAHDGNHGELVGASLEATWWWWRIGLAIEGAQRHDIGDDGVRTTVLGTNARVLVVDQLLPSLLEPSDVELGLELHGVIERAWSSRVDRGDDPAVRYGLGIAARLRGGGDDTSSLLAESRLFVRVLWARTADTANPIARAATSVTDRAGDRETLVIIGLGAAWGAGERHYADRFRTHTTETIEWGQITIDR